MAIFVTDISDTARDVSIIGVVVLRLLRPQRAEISPHKVLYIQPIL